MIDVIENPDRVVFECDHCGGKITWNTIPHAVFLYGIIFLIRNNDRYFGLTCPNPKCKKTTLKNCDKNFYYTLKFWLFDIDGYGI